MSLLARNGQALPEFQFTAMIDVVFLLLCFFVTTSVFSQWEMEVDVVLPSAQSSQMPDRLPGEVIVNLSRDGTITINQRKYTPDELRDRLSRLAQLFPGQPVIIRADKDSRTEQLIGIVDVCRTADIWNISFATIGDN
ncbi:MAG: biopolymer transporter ExbD [Kiritimatiellae bacterium]|jgi:biopolymer transport protein ExbD|nr:biopolymer transporter ExbD [Kiritimatiellia bacterium]MBR4613671.1 biopolymer transporter ExbD [Kiritimatiellia bacterium]